MKQLLIVQSLILSTYLKAQDLDPRAYARVPINGTVMVAGYAFSNGNVVTDPSLPLEKVKANVRLSVLVKGAPAATLRELIKAKQKQIIGASLTVTAPVGLYNANKLINIGTHRWSFKPEIAISHPLYK